MCWPFRCLDLDVSYPDTYLVNPGYSRKRKVDKCPGCETGAYELPGGDIPGSMGFSVQVAMYNIIELHHILMPKYNILPIYWALQCMVWFVKIFPQGVENIWCIMYFHRGWSTAWHCAQLEWTKIVSCGLSILRLINAISRTLFRKNRCSKVTDRCQVDV